MKKGGDSHGFTSFTCSSDSNAYCRSCVSELLFMSFRQQSVAIIERFGKYQKLSNSGIHLRAPFGIDKIAARVQLRLLQSEIVVETKTQDNVFVTMNVATQYRVNELNVTDAYYKLMRPEAQIKSYIEDALRSSVPKLTLDELFEKKR